MHKGRETMMKGCSLSFNEAESDHFGSLKGQNKAVLIISILQNNVTNSNTFETNIDAICYG